MESRGEYAMLRRMSNEETKRPGRKPVYDRPMLAPVTIRLPGSMNDQIEAIAATRADAPDKAQVIRELLAKALENSTK